MAMNIARIPSTCSDTQQVGSCVTNRNEHMRVGGELHLPVVTGSGQTTTTKPVNAPCLFKAHTISTRPEMMVRLGSPVTGDDTDDEPTFRTTVGTAPIGAEATDAEEAGGKSAIFVRGFAVSIQTG
jgi:hypothetical protein